MNECFACESQFEPLDAASNGVPLDSSQSYCSLECYKQFNTYLELQVSLAQEYKIEPLATTQESIAGVAKTLTQFIRAQSLEQAQTEKSLETQERDDV